MLFLLKKLFIIHSWMRADVIKKIILMMPAHFILLSDYCKMALFISFLSMWNFWLRPTSLRAEIELRRESIAIRIYFLSIISL